MKTTILKFFTLSAAIFAFSTISFGQANNATETAQAAANANIVTPISITKNVDLNFGNIAAASTAFTVKLDESGTRTSNGGTGTLPSVAGTVTAAKFTASGLTGATYAVTLPSSITITYGTNNMTVDDFKSNATLTLTGGSETFNVGATLNVGANQVAGAYTGTFNVVVNYN